MTFTFTEEEINAIYNALANLPWKQVSQLMNNIMQQYTEQKEESNEVDSDNRG